MYIHLLEKRASHQAALADEEPTSGSNETLGFSPNVHPSLPFCQEVSFPWGVWGLPCDSFISIRVISLPAPGIRTRFFQVDSTATSPGWLKNVVCPQLRSLEFGHARLFYVFMDVPYVASCLNPLRMLAFFMPTSSIADSFSYQ